MKFAVTACALVVASILVTSACTGESQSAVSEAAHLAAKKKVEALRYKRVAFDTDAGAFWFEPATCLIMEENGSLSYDINGPGQSPDGQAVYVSMGGHPSAGVEMGISVGVDVPYKRGDPKWNSNDYQSVALGVAKSQVDIEGRVVTSTGVVFGKDYGGQLVVNGPIRVDCNS